MERLKRWWRTQKRKESYRWKGEITWWDYFMPCFAISMLVMVSVMMVVGKRSPPYMWIGVMLTIPMMIKFCLSLYVRWDMLRAETWKKSLDHLIHVKFARLCDRHGIPRHAQYTRPDIKAASQIAFLESVHGNSNVNVMLMFRDKDMSRIKLWIEKYWSFT